MGAPGLKEQESPRLLGRESECAAIDSMLEDARAGIGGALVVRGEPGIGKSALLDYARQRAAPMAVLTAAGVEAESDLAFAGLHELLRPVLGYLGELPDIQSPGALDPAQKAALIRVTGATITFRHPLVRSALYQAATLSERQRVHAALADALSGEENTDRRVWHQAMATLTGDEEVAAALEASARRAQLRAGHASAATAFLRAAQLSTDGARRAYRMAAAGQAAWDAGQPDRAREIVRQVLPLATGQTRVQLLHLSGLIEAFAGHLREAFTLLADAVATCTDPSLTIEILTQAADAVAELSQQATRLSPANELDRFKIAVLGGFARFYAGEHRAGQALLADALRSTDAMTDPYVLLWAGDAATTSKGLGAGLPYVTRAVDAARRRGLLSLLAPALRYQAREFVWSSQFSLAYAAAQEGYRLSLDLGYGAAGHLMNMAAVEATWAGSRTLAGMRTKRSHMARGMASCSRRSWSGHSG